jgi:hypothetical protein
MTKCALSTALRDLLAGEVIEEDVKFSSNFALHCICCIFVPSVGVGISDTIGGLLSRDLQREY